MDDYISRELVAVGLALKVKRRDFDAIDLQDAQRFIASIHPADVRPVVRGEWIELENPNYSPFDPTSQEYDLLCSHCGATHYGKDKNFCPNCGAKMGGVNLGTD